MYLNLSISVQGFGVVRVVDMIFTFNDLECRESRHYEIRTKICTKSHLTNSLGFA